ncbi:hypothetical protein P5V15_013842 [Pogonomyrmex californicus]
MTFALTKTTEFNLCGYQLYRTEHPKLIILETQKGKTFAARSQISVNNLDIFAYVNSKFVYVEKHVKHQLAHPALSRYYGAKVRTGEADPAECLVPLRDSS